MKAACLIILFGAILAMGTYGQTTRKKVIFFGDSITELGVKPGGYIDLLQKDTNVAEKFELIGAGVSGNKIYDLFLRINPDVIDRKPDVVVIYIGINDIWHKRLLGTGTDLDKFGKFYDALLKRLTDAKATVIVCTPTVIGERLNQTNEMDGELNLYSEFIRSFAKTNSLQLVDLRKAFVDEIATRNAGDKPSGILTGDKVHLNAEGNKLVAAEMKRALMNVK